MTYRGETPGKKLTRLRYWEGVKKQMGPRFFTSYHVVLLSAQAGDISVLMGLGVYPQFIIGVDIDKHAVAASRHRFRKAACIHDDVVNTIKMLVADKVKIGSVFLDFCQPLSKIAWRTIDEALPLLNRGTVFGCAFLMCREQGGWKAKIDKLKAGPDYDSYKSRADLITRELKVTARKHGRTFSVQEFIRYSSHSSDRYGKPMIVCRGTLAPSRKRAASRKSVPRILLEANPIELGIRATQLEKAGRSSALLLNAPPHSVSAWRAHATRGTYDE